jgi:hypothetical protein
MKTKHLLCAVGAAAALMLQSAHSQTLTVDFVEINPNVAVNGAFYGTGSFTEIASGIVKFETFDAFCAEPFQSLADGISVVYDIQDPATLTNSGTVASLIGGYLASGRTNLDAAAVQWAIWEVVAETSGTFSLSSGNILIGANTAGSPNSSDVAALASQYLANVGSYTPANLTYLTNSTYQNVVTWQVIPEPSTVGLLGLSALVLIRRRRA